MNSPIDAPTDMDSHPDRNYGTDISNVVIKCSGLSKIFKDFWLRSRVRAVDGIDLEVRRGEVFGLLGPNGSGKSTTIKMILGLLHPTSGRIAVFSRPPSDVAIKQRIGYLPEESYLYRFLNARETLEYYGRLFCQDWRQRQHRSATLLEMVGLDRVARRPVGEYSKGMQRRIGLAQALINDPELLILDEPTTGLDPIGTRQIKDLILELARRGKTIILCSHLLADVEDICDRVAIMFGGRVKREGTVEELLEIVGQTVITAPTLPELSEERMIELLENHGFTDLKVNRPRKKLESLFLQIVHEAQAEGAVTSGAHADGKIADFLVAESAHLPKSTDPVDLIDGLTIHQAPAESKRIDSPAARNPGPEKAAAVKPRPESNSAPPVHAGASARGPVGTDLELIDDLVIGFDKPGQLPLSTSPAATGPKVERSPTSQPDETRSKPAVERVIAESEESIVADESVELSGGVKDPPSQHAAIASHDATSSSGDNPALEQPDQVLLDALVNVEPTEMAEEESQNEGKQNK